MSRVSRGLSEDGTLDVEWHRLEEGGIQYKGGPFKAWVPPLFQTQMANTLNENPARCLAIPAIPCSILFLCLHLPQPPLLSHPLRRDHQDETSGARRCRVPQPGPARPVEIFSCGSRAKTAKGRKGGNKVRCEDRRAGHRLHGWQMHEICPMPIRPRHQTQQKWRSLNLQDLLLCWCGLQSLSRVVISGGQHSHSPSHLRASRQNRMMLDWPTLGPGGGERSSTPSITRRHSSD
jgi:hypothetical protein